ncbi:MAG: type 1 glutamine amidotransferase [Thermodesulfobacteria bacterium]|nr:type 1 glutamine amidotransferase [Thermodesulfobacteriota bacterium]
MSVLIMTANGFEDTELLCPLYRFQEEGLRVDVCAPTKGDLRGKHGYTVTANLSLSEARSEDYQVLYIPGGKAPEELRRLPEALKLVRDFQNSKKLIVAICHGPLVLVSAGILRGRRATGYPKIAEELKAAGVNYQDHEVVVDRNIITSRRPRDLPALMKTVIENLKAPDFP